MCCCCCCEENSGGDAYYGGDLTGTPVDPLGVGDLGTTGSPICANTDFADQALQNLQSNPLPTNTGDAACYQPLTTGTTDNPVLPCNKNSNGSGSGGNSGSGNLGGSGNGSGSAAGKCNKAATGQCTSALSNAVNTLGSLLNKLTSSPTGSAVGANIDGSATTPTTIGMIVIVLLLGGLLIAMAFGSKA